MIFALLSLICIWSRDALGSALDFESGVKYSYEKRDYKDLCSLKKVNVYKIISAECIEKIILEYDAHFAAGNINDVRRRAFALFLTMVFARNEEVTPDMSGTVHKVGLETKNLLTSALARSLGTGRAAQIIGIRNPSAIVIPEDSYVSLKAWDTQSIKVNISNIDDLKRNLEMDVYIWAAFSATGNTVYLDKILTYLSHMPSFIRGLYTSYVEEVAHDYDYAIIPIHDENSILVSLDEFLDRHREGIDGNIGHSLRTRGFTLWSVASYLLILNHIDINCSRYKDIGSLVSKMINENTAYKRLRKKNAYFGHEGL